MRFNIFFSFFSWMFTPAVELGSSYYWGKISAYGGGGYYLDLSVTKEQTEKMLEELKNNRWISQGTRSVFIDFTIYNANANLFCVCKYVSKFFKIKNCAYEIFCLE